MMRLSESFSTRNNKKILKTGCDYKKGNTDLETFKRAEFIMHSLGLKRRR